MENLTPLSDLPQFVGCGQKSEMSESRPLLQAASSADFGDDKQHGNISSNMHGSESDENDRREDVPVSLERNFYNPAMHRTLEHPTSNFDTMIHLLKGNIGTGILAMPDAFKNAGLYMGFFSTLIIGAICTHCMHMLVHSANELCSRLRQPSLSFSEVAYWSFESGPNALRDYRELAKRTVTTFLCITQIGFCCVYFLFVALNLKEVFDHFFITLDVRIYLMLLLLPMVPLNLVKNLKYLTPVSFVASILTLVGLVITFTYILHDLPHSDTVDGIASWSSLPLYFGTAIYAFEGIGVVLPLENNMRNPGDFVGWTGVLNTGMIIVACLYTSVGFFGYLKYGKDVKGSITLNLPSEDILSQLVRIAMAVAIFMSYPLQFYVPVNIVEPHILRHFETSRAKELAAIILRVALVIFTFILASCIPNLSPIISLVGAISSSALALIAPPIIEMVTFWSVGYGRYSWMLIKDVSILIFGLCGFVFGTYSSVAQILSTSNN